MTKLKDSHSDEAQNATKLIDSNCDKLQKSSCDKTQLSHFFKQTSRTQFWPKLKNSNSDKT